MESETHQQRRHDAGDLSDTLRIAFPPTFCGLPSSTEVRASSLGLMRREAAVLSELLDILWFERHGLAEDAETEPELMIALGVVASAYVRVGRGLRLKIREGTSPWGLLDDIARHHEAGGPAVFREKKIGSSLRRRFRQSVSRLDRDRPRDLDDAIDAVQRLLADSTPVDWPRSPDELRQMASVDVPNFDRLGDRPFFESEGVREEQTEEASPRYRFRLGPLLPERVWILVTGSLAFLRDREALTGSSPLGPGVPTASEAEDEIGDAFDGDDLLAAVRRVAETVAAVIRFDRDAWLRSGKTELDGDLAVAVSALDADQLCDLIADLICTAEDASVEIEGGA